VTSITPKENYEIKVAFATGTDLGFVFLASDSFALGKTKRVAAAHSRCRSRKIMAKLE
jgi:hypothetical protein